MRPVTVNDSAEPGGLGAGTPGTEVAREKLPSDSGTVRKRRSYAVARPVTPSSPGAVQWSVALPKNPALETAADPASQHAHSPPLSAQRSIGFTIPPCILERARSGPRARPGRSE